MDFPHNQFGYPLAESYGLNVDLALVRTNYSTKWRRQRRSYGHNASLINLTFRLSTNQSNSLVKWLQENDDWFNMNLISGNDADEQCAIYLTEVRRTSTISCTRIPLQSAFLVSFEVETNKMVQYETLLAAAAGAPATTYPSNLPLPQADGFQGEHDDRNVTTYTLEYVMNTSILKQWQEFAGYAGTAWFNHPMVSANVACGYEVLRYTSAFDMTLIGPDKWRVSVTAEGYPNRGYLEEFKSAAIEECAYDYPIDYNEADESYDCSGGGVTPPPQGSFVTPDGTYVIASSVTGIAPQSTVGILRLNRDGSVGSDPVGSPAWAKWHTDANTLTAPAVTINTTVEVSVNGGVNWSTNIPGTKYQLKTQDVWLRLQHSASVAEVKALSVELQFDDGTITYAVSSVTVQFNSSITITYPGAGFVSNFAWVDTDSIMVPAATTEDTLLSVGVQSHNDGTCSASSTGDYTGPWYNTIIPGIGNSLWVQVNYVSGNLDMSNDGVRLSMSTNLNFGVVARKRPGTAEYTGLYQGQVFIYDSQVGGTLLASGTIYLEAIIMTDV